MDVRWTCKRRLFHHGYGRWPASCKQKDRGIEINMKKNIFAVFILFLFFFFVIEKNKMEDFPIPTEIIQKKKNKKQFKQERNQWILNIHKSAPELDWKQQDIDNRKINTDVLRENRKSMLNLRLNKK